MIEEIFRFFGIRIEYDMMCLDERRGEEGEEKEYFVGGSVREIGR